MTPRAPAVLAVIALAVIALAAIASAGSAGPTPPPTIGPSLPATPEVALRSISIPPATAPPVTGSPGTPSPYTFDDEFDGAALGALWQRDFHCCGNLAGFDPSLTTVANGYLSMAVALRSDGWYADLIDTKSTWTQEYGYFAARIEIPAGAGLWPAFWGYFEGGGTQAEIDTMEVCPGKQTASGGSVLHTSVFWTSRRSATKATPTVDLSQAFHVYAMDWRADHVTFYLDGSPVWTFTDASHIPAVALPLILDLGVGGTFCGSPDATTPSGARMLVDWVRVEP